MTRSIYLDKKTRFNLAQMKNNPLKSFYLHLQAFQSSGIQKLYRQGKEKHKPKMKDVIRTLLRVIRRVTRVKNASHHDFKTPLESWRRSNGNFSKTMSKLQISSRQMSARFENYFWLRCVIISCGRINFMHFTKEIFTGGVS